MSPSFKLGFLTFGLLVLQPVVLAQPVPVASTRNGTYQGLYLPTYNQDVFLGIPFANAPRFGLPTTITTSWNGTRTAYEYGPNCPGSGTDNYDPAIKSTSEDCLSINIIRPSGTNSSSNLPVMYWIYGGGYTQGATAVAQYNLTFLVQESVAAGKPMIAVSINYRKTGWGFLASKQVLDAGLANLGLRDQRKGLEWVQENIYGFGGDPRMVTIAGESAGAGSVSNQLIAYGGKSGDLFRGGIMASGSVTGFPLPAGDAFQPVYDSFLNATNCTFAIDTLDCLRQQPFTFLQALWNTSTISYGPILDGDFLQLGGPQMLASGKFARVPILQGANADEGLSFVSAGLTANTTGQLIQALTSTYRINSSQAADFAALYPFGSSLPPYSVDPSVDIAMLTANLSLGYGSQIRRAFGWSGDLIMHAPRRLMSQTWVQHNVPCYAYVFDTNPTLLHYYPGLGIGWAMHGSDLSFEFGFIGQNRTPYQSVANVTSEIMVSHAMMRTWISFVHDLDPNNHGLDYLPYWPQYDEAANGKVFYMNGTLDNTTNFHVEEDTYRQAPIKYINDHVPQFYGQ